MPQAPHPTPQRADEPTPIEMLEDVLDLIGGGVAALLPLFVLCVPGIVLLGIVLVPLAVLAVPVGLAVALLAGPYFLVRALRRR
jgi:hypothetical protein